MKKRALFKELKKHRELANKRAFNFEQNKVAKYVLGVVYAMVLIYLVFFAIIFALAANDTRSMTSVEFIMALAPFILLLDFLIRFMAQQTPAQIIKPYILLPIPKYTCIDSLIGTSLFNWGNLTWFVMLVPFALMSVVFSQGIWVTLGFFLCYYLLILANSQWYAIVRAYINDSLLWWILPIAVYALIFLPVFKYGFDFYGCIGTAISSGNILPYFIPLAILAGLVYINRKVQFSHIWKELAKVETSKSYNSKHYAFLEKQGDVGQYIQLEIKSTIRNKNVKKSFIFATAIVFIMSLVISFTDAYDNQFMTNFWCLYNFVVYGAMILVRVMCNEGNYIDCLMVRRENILKLLHAKYIFFSIVLLFPFILMLPTVFTGKWSIFMLVSYMFFTAGFQYFILFQMAVYNKQTLPLNTKFISKNGMENNYFQIIAEMVAFILPMMLVSVLQAALGENISYAVMLVIGLAFILTYPIWLRNIYHRMMKKKYELLDGFRSSR
jgi:hypothetical protein